MNHILKFIIAAIFIFLFVLSIQGQSLKQYTVHRTTVPIVVDGLLSDSSWAHTSFTEEFISLKGNPSGMVTKTQMLWDSNYLYLGFTIEDNSIWSTLRGKDAELWNQDVVEIFIDPDGDGLNYMELGFSPNGNMYDYLISKSIFEGGKINLDWGLDGILWKVTVNGKLNSANESAGWTCEVAIPFGTKLNSSTTITKPKEQDYWRLNLCRVDYDYKKSESVRFTNWNYTNGINFHVPSRFGKIVFSETLVDEKNSNR